MASPSAKAIDCQCQAFQLAIEVLGHVINSVLAQWVMRTVGADEVGDVLERTARLVIR